MQIPPTMLLLEPLRDPQLVYDIPPVVVRRRRIRALVTRIHPLRSRR